MPHDLRFPQVFEARYCARLGAVGHVASDLSKLLLLVLFLSPKTCWLITQAFYSSRPLDKTKILPFF